MSTNIIQKPWFLIAELTDKNVLGMRGKTLVVVQAFNGSILTSYLAKGKDKIRKS